jgi:hypothetical protein
LDTGEAINYFGTTDGETSPKAAVVERIVRLRREYTTATGWKLVIDVLTNRNFVCGMRLLISN